MAALIASFDVPAQGGRTASTEGAEDSALLPGSAGKLGADYHT